MNNPLLYTDYNGNDPVTVAIVTAAVIGAIIGGVSYVAINLYNGTALSWGGLAKSILTGAISGAATGGIGQIAGSIFTATATGFLQGALQGAITGAITGTGGAFINAILNGDNPTLKDILKGALTGAVVGGVIGGIQGGINALDGEANFWTGNKTFDTSNGVGAHSEVAQEIVKNGSIKGKYVGKFEGVKIYENKALGVGELSGGLTLPPDSIIVGKGVYELFQTSEYVQDLLHHEFGHILQYRIPFVGSKFYSVIAPESSLSASLHGKIINPLQSYSLHNHHFFWTETWANKLSMNYFGNGVFNNQYLYRGESIGLFNLSKFFKP